MSDGRAAVCVERAGRIVIDPRVSCARRETVSGGAEEGGRGEGKEASKGGRARGRAPGGRGLGARGTRARSPIYVVIVH